ISGSSILIQKCVSVRVIPALIVRVCWLTNRSTIRASQQSIVEVVWCWSMVGPEQRHVIGTILQSVIIGVKGNHIDVDLDAYCFQLRGHQLAIGNPVGITADYVEVE